MRKLRDAAAAGSGDKQALLKTAEQLLRKASSKGVLHKKTVSRTVSRLAKLVQR